MNKLTKDYTPDKRSYLEQDQKKIKSYSPTGNTYSELPDNVRDPIVANNIINAELDYTEDSQIDFDE